MDLHWTHRSVTNEHTHTLDSMVVVSKTELLYT